MVDQLSLHLWRQLIVEAILSDHVVVLAVGPEHVAAHICVKVVWHSLSFGGLRLLNPMHPLHHIEVALSDETLKAAVNLDNLTEGNLERSKDDEPEEFYAESKYILKARASSVVSITYCRDDCADPVVGKNDQLNIAHILEVIVCKGPRHTAILIINVAFTSDVDEEAAEVVQKNNDLTEGGASVENHLNLVLAFNGWNVIDSPFHWVVEQPDLV